MAHSLKYPQTQQQVGPLTLFFLKWFNSLIFKQLTAAQSFLVNTPLGKKGIHLLQEKVLDVINLS